MDSLGLLARIAAAAIGLSAVGTVVSLVVGLLATPAYLLQSLVVLVLVFLVVGGLARLGVRGSGGTETTYW
jgi:hypothetical protein